MPALSWGGLWRVLILWCMVADTPPAYEGFEYALFSVCMLFTSVAQLAGTFSDSFAAECLRRAMSP